MSEQMTDLTKLLRELEQRPDRFTQTERKRILDAAIAALESRVLAGMTPVAEVIKWRTLTGHTAWDFKVFDKTLEHGTKLFTHPAPDDARKESK